MWIVELTDQKGNKLLCVCRDACCASDAIIHAERHAADGNRIVDWTVGAVVRLCEEVSGR